MAAHYPLNTYQKVLGKPTRLASSGDQIWLIDEGRQELLQFDMRWASTGLDHALLGEEYWSVDLPGAALDELNRSIAVGFREAWYLLKGKAEYRLKLYQDAMQSFSEAKKAGTSVDSDVWIANTHFRLGRYQKALAIFEDLLATSKVDPILLRHNSAETFMALARFSEAETLFRKIARDYPADARAKLGLARALLGLRRYRDLVSQLDALTSDKIVGREARHYLGLAYLESGQLETALPLLEQASREGPFFRESLRALATAHRRLGSVERAEHYENLVKNFGRLADQLSVDHLLEHEK